MRENGATNVSPIARWMRWCSFLLCGALLVHCSQQRQWIPPKDAKNACDARINKFETHPDWRVFERHAIDSSTNACLQISWGTASFEAAKTSIVKLTSNGRLNHSSDGAWLKLPPESKGKTLRFRLFAFTPKTIGQRTKLCRDAMNQPGYLCHDNPNDCLFYIDFKPDTTDIADYTFEDISGDPALSCKLYLRQRSRELPLEKPEPPDTSEPPVDAAEPTPDLREPIADIVPEPIKEQPQETKDEVKDTAPTTSRWFWTAGGEGPDRGMAIAVDSQNNTYVLGYINAKNPRVPGNKGQVVGIGKRDVALFKFDPLGELVWFHIAGSAGDDTGNALAIDSKDNIYITGYYTLDAKFGASDLFAQSKVNAIRSTYVAKLSGEGKWKWAKHLEGTSNHQAVTITIDSKDNVYIAGIYQKNLNVPNKPPGIKTLGSPNTRHYIASIDTDGNWLWLESLEAGEVSCPPSQCAHLMQIQAATFGNVESLFVAGSFTRSAFNTTGGISSKGGRDAYVAQLKLDGTHVKTTHIGSPADEAAHSISISKHQIVIAGYYRGKLDFDSIELPSAGDQNIFVAAMDASGKWLWAVRSGGTSDEVALGVAASDDGTVYVTGYLTNSVSFDGRTTTVTNKQKAFVARLDANHKWHDILLGGGIPRGATWPPTPNRFNYDLGAAIARTPSGGYVVTGSLTNKAFGTRTTSVPPYAGLHFFVASNIVQ